MDDHVYCHDATNGDRIFKEKFTESVSFVALNFDNTLLAVGTLDKNDTVVVLELEGFTRIAQFSQEDGEITAMKFHPKGNIILTSYTDGSLHMYSADKKTLVRSFFGHIDEVTDAQFSNDGMSLSKLRKIFTKFLIRQNNSSMGAKNSRTDKQTRGIQIPSRWCYLLQSTPYKEDHC